MSSEDFSFAISQSCSSNLNSEGHSHFEKYDWRIAKILAVHWPFFSFFFRIKVSSFAFFQKKEVQLQLQQKFKTCIFCTKFWKENRFINSFDNNRKWKKKIKVDFEFWFFLKNIKIFISLNLIWLLFFPEIYSSVVESCRKVDTYENPIFVFIMVPSCRRRCIELFWKFSPKNFNHSFVFVENDWFANKVRTSKFRCTITNSLEIFSCCSFYVEGDSLRRKFLCSNFMFFFQCLPVQCSTHKTCFLSWRSSSTRIQFTLSSEKQRTSRLYFYLALWQTRSW